MIRSFAGMSVCALCACVTGAAAPTDPGAAGNLPPRLASSKAEPAGIAGIYSPCGFTVVGNSGDLHFRMQLGGSKVSLQHGQSNDVYVVDGLQVQTTVVAAETMGATARGLTGIELLRMHATWESAHLSTTFGREVQPEEIAILAADNMPSALVWWFAGASAGPSAAPAANAYEGASGEAAQPAANAGPEPSRPTGLVFATAAYDDRVLVMSVQGLRGEPRPAMVDRAKSWFATVMTSPRAISVRKTRADIKAAMAAGQTCEGRPNAIFEQGPAQVDEAPQAGPVDTSLRLDGLSEQDKAQAKTVAQAHGGVARQTTAAGTRVTNNICRFEIVLPPGWQEFATQDFNGHGCSTNLTTAEVFDPREPKPVSNAVAIVTAHVSELDRETLHQRMLFTLKNGKARIVRVTPSMVSDAIEDHFQSEKDGHALEGDLITLQRGDFLYQIFFTATPGTYASGRANFIQFLGGATWGTVR